MKLRLKITSPTGETRYFEHPGPSVRIGRQPGFELELRGGESQSISREHARIDLTPTGAVVADLGSSNGTLLNDKRIPEPSPIRVGDRIRLGYTGPALTVVEVDLGHGLHAPSAIPRSLLVPLVIGGAIGLLLLVLAIVLLVKTLPTVPKSNGPDETQVATVVPPPTSVAVVPAPKPDRPDNAAVPPAVAQGDPPAAAPDDDREVAVGSYLVLPQWGPSVLLERRGEGYPRARLRSEARVMSSHTLLCLPGYRAHLQLDSGIHLELWGNVPEFCSVPSLLLESAVVLKAADPGDVDLDLVLVRGRIHIANPKKAGSARIRLRYLREAWEITLPDANSEICAELWATLQPPSEKGSDGKLPVTLGLFTKGKVALRTSPKTEILDLPDGTRISRMNEANARLYRSAPGQIPDWWLQPPDIKQARVADVMLSLKDWDQHLQQPGDLLYDVFKLCESNRSNQPADRAIDPTFRCIGAYFLGSFDAEGIPLAVRLLEDPDHTEVRRAAAHSLRAWLARDARNEDTLRELLRARIDPPQRASDVQRLLHPFPADTVSNRAKWSQVTKDLFDLMNDSNVALRDLAAWHLAEIARVAGIRELPLFDAGAPAEARSRVVREWQRMLAGGPRAPS
jgi:hypothetical protein